MRYEYKDETTEKVVTVDRKIDDRDIIPTQEEAEMSEDEYTKAVWVRLVTGGIGHVGFGMKGMW